MDPGRTPEGDLQPLGPDYAEDSSVPQKYCCPGQESTTGGRTRERDSRNTPEGHLEPLGPEEERKPLARTLERDPRHTPEGHVQPVGPDYGSTPKRNPKYNRKDRRRALLKAARRTIGETRLWSVKRLFVRKKIRKRSIFEVLILPSPPHILILLSFLSE